MSALDSGRGVAALGGGVRLVLVRHGVTDYTVSGRLDGRGGADPPLTAHGLAQAKAVSELVPTLRGDGHEHLEVVTSSLQRVRMTGAAIAGRLGVPAAVDADWDERNFGRWDGLTFAEIEARDPGQLALMRSDPDRSAPGGESRSAVATRVLAALDRVVAGPPARTVVVVTSRVPLLVVLNHVLAMAPQRFWALDTAPASVSVVDLWPDGHVSVPTVNRTDHLP